MTQYNWDEIQKTLEEANIDESVIAKMKEELEEAKATTAQKKELAALMRKALGGKRPKPGYTSSIATNGDFVVHDGGMRVVGRIKAGDFTNPMKEEFELEEKVNVKAIQKAVDDGKSMDVIMTMFANKRTTNTDEIRKVVKDYMWKKRMKKEEVELEENMVASLAKDFENRVKKQGYSSRTHERERMATLAMAKKKGAKPADMKALDAAIVKIINKLDEELQEAYMDEKSCVGEMKKLHASSCSKMEMYKKVSEKYGCSKEKFEELYAQYCKETYKEELDPVNPKAVKKKFDDRKDKDIDNDGDVDSSDEYLHKRRKAVSKEVEKDKDVEEGKYAKNPKQQAAIAIAKKEKASKMESYVSAISKDVSKRN